MTFLIHIPQFAARLAFMAACCMLACMASAQVRLMVSVIPTSGTVCLDEIAEYRIILENSPETPQLKTPLFRNFSVIGSPAREDGISSVNGRVTRYMAWVFILKPKKAGRFRIDACTAVIGGKEYRSEAVVIEVSNCHTAGSMPSVRSYSREEVQKSKPEWQDQVLKTGEDPDDKARKNLSMNLEVSKKSCYVGEPIKATYNLFSRLRCESKITRHPSFNGFSVIDLPGPNQFSTPVRTINGRAFNEYTLRTSQLYPLQPGLIEIEPAEIENEVSFVKEEYLREQGMMEWMDEYALAMLPGDAIIRSTVAVRNQPVTIQVKPLPENGKPAGFDGAVGQFVLHVSLDKKTIAMNESGILTVTVRGIGNLQLLNAPVVNWPSSFEVFEPKYKEAIDKTVMPVAGAKSFAYAFSVKDTGTFIIPPVRFSFFDPQTEKYQIIETAPLTISVGPAMQVQGDAMAMTQKSTGFINRIFYHRWWIVIFIASLVLVGLLFWIWRDRYTEQKNKHDKSVQEKDLHALVSHNLDIAPTVERNPLEEAEHCLQTEHISAFHTILNREFRDYLSGSFQWSLPQINANHIAAMLQKKSVPTETALQVQVFMQGLEQILYTPFGVQADPAQLINEARHIISLLDAYKIKLP